MVLQLVQVACRARLDLPSPDLASRQAAECIEMTGISKQISPQPRHAQQMMSSVLAMASPDRPSLPAPSWPRSAPRQKHSSTDATISLTANPCPAHPSASPSTYTDTRSIASRMRQAAWGSSRNPPGRPGISSSFPPPLPRHLLQLSFALRLQRHDSTIPYLAHISEGPASKSPERRSRGGAARASKKRLADQGKRDTLAGIAKAPNPEHTNDAKPAFTGSRPSLSGAGNANQEIGPKAHPPAENRPAAKAQPAIHQPQPRSMPSSALSLLLAKSRCRTRFE
ncbi:uncharacterized protein VDAG_03676 [Verticillium dahliae VdLs.17]|uniref:Uncharacterized protein n=1 Tax=Verticillium dahliae (strain VdLs.17 / ATCC MYA-4575 / FGSC 10137) TaxID=498257 RepID=G2X097_VERDV|nr:uncharacterized protein VDAG_03676 [Verticillium dahliae VdLs.17]EGY22238.1 hypothetical protein VDAG_03676 [Verticillium dahliae VdLs.17]KAH6704631.1 hypothetical protein EV126DRAFT_380548 [Verticillium dahliae]